ncbi:PepSY domain-containing protein [Oceanobacillus sp. FSL H7-0719]|uniref:PepSY domain-containing protein n=1 Tax=Oceanobacillus sp. FSL H7-0719 TaxID=2954507 RepID=UPI0032539FE6
MGKKSKGIVIGALAGAAILGMGAYHSSASSADLDAKLSREEVKEIIQIEYPGAITEFDLEKENGRIVYDMKIKGENAKYELEVDADTGEVLEVSEENYKHKTNKEEIVKSEHTPEDILSVKEAEEIAQKEFAGTITEIELDEDDGRYVYEVELREGAQEAEIELDAVTGDILELDIDFED